MEAVFSPQERINTWLQIEIQALKTRARLGDIPKEIPDRVASKASVEWSRVCEIEEKTRHDVLAFLAALNEKLGDEARYVHYGMTSSDVVDTGLAIQCRKGLIMILGQLEKLTGQLIALADKYRNTPSIGRSHGVHGEPVVLGLKFLLWASDFSRLIKLGRVTLEMISVGKCSGAMGTLVYLTPEFEEDFCKNLGLRVEPVATQIVQRDRHAQLACFFALIGAEIEKISVELRHLQRTEVLEMEEGFSKGQKGSSAMPHKKNPVSAENLTGCARMLKSYVHAALDNVALWHERDISHSSVERVFLPDSFILTDYSLDRLEKLLSGLCIHEKRVKANLEATRGLIFSQRILLTLTEKGMSRDGAYLKVQEASMAVWADDRLHLKDVLKKDKEVSKYLSSDDIERSFALDPYLKHIDAIYARTKRAIESNRTVVSNREDT